MRAPAEARRLSAFFAAIMPREGVKCALQLPSRRQFFTDDFDELAATILESDTSGSNVYHACAAFRERGSRTKENASGARSLWLDVDAGEGKPYRDATAAAEAVVDFCRRANLPQPIFVGSGYGVHCYWPLDRMLTPEAWLRMAQGLKRCCEEHGLKADHSRTTDIASILRSPGTHNRKNPDTSRSVQVGPLVGPYDAAEFMTRLDLSVLAFAPVRKSLIDAASNVHAPPAYSEAEERRVRSALVCVSSEARDTWLRTGMALHSTGWGEQARRIWDDWSRTTPAKFNSADQDKAWESFDRPYGGQKLTLGTLYAMAKANGWAEPPPLVAEPVVAFESLGQSASLRASHNWRDHVVSASDLRLMKFEPIRYVLPRFIPEGLSFLVGRPKIGKSWLALDLCLACAAGRATLGTLQPLHGDVLYLALEDNKRRLQSRIGKLLPTFSGDWPERLKLVPMGGWPRADQGGLGQIEDWCKSVPAPRLVVIDTLERIRKPADGRKQPYNADSEAIIPFQKIASDLGIAILVLHHDRKSDADDAHDTVSGTLGLTAPADATLVMKRRDRGVILYARGRDIEESETALQFDKATCRWSILGAAAEIQRSDERSRILTALREASQPLSVREIMIDANMRSRNATDLMLSKMVRSGEIERIGRGRYRLPSTSGQIGQTDGNQPDPADSATKTGDLSNLSDLSESRVATDAPIQD